MDTQERLERLLSGFSAKDVANARSRVSSRVSDEIAVKAELNRIDAILARYAEHPIGRMIANEIHSDAS